MKLRQKPQAYTSTEQRLRGRTLQKTRLRLWSRFPFCAMCKKLTIYPEGFELDHKLPIFKGGDDSDTNLQILCHECHRKKTAEDMGTTYRVPIGLDGWPIG
jgi:5-methylcytosine-specific restriction enzyme A